MGKRVFAVIIAFVTAIASAACGGLSEPSAMPQMEEPVISNSPRPSEQPVAISPAASEQPVEKDYPALYAPVLDEYRRAIRNESLGSDLDNAFRAVVARRAFSEDDCGYALKDINGNGTQELILLVNSDEVAVYSLVGDTPYMLASSAGGKSIDVCGDGTIVMVSTPYTDGGTASRIESAMENKIYAIYNISGGDGALAFTGGYRSERDDAQGTTLYYYHTTEPTDSSAPQAEAQSITAEEFSERTGAFIPLDYKAEEPQLIPLFGADAEIPAAPEQDEAGAPHDYREEFDLIAFAAQLGYEHNEAVETYDQRKDIESCAFRYYYPNHTESEPDFADVAIARYDNGSYTFAAVYSWGWWGIVQEYVDVPDDEIPPEIMERLEKETPTAGPDGQISYGCRLDDYEIKDIKIKSSSLFLSAEELELCKTVLERVAQARNHDDPTVGFEDDFGT